MRLEEFLEKKHDIFARHYVIVSFDDSTPEGKEVSAQLRKQRGGIPWMAILNAKGKTLVTSDGPKGNIGYPLKAPEIEFFLEMVDTTAERITKDEKAEIKTALEEAAARIEKNRKR